MCMIEGIEGGKDGRRTRSNLDNTFGLMERALGQLLRFILREKIEPPKQRPIQAAIIFINDSGRC